MLAGAPTYSNPITSTADQTITGGTAVALTSLASGPTGRIRVTAHPANTGVVIRVSDSGALVGKGQPLAAGISQDFTVTNAASLYAIVESGTGKLCVSAV